MNRPWTEADLEVLRDTSLSLGEVAERIDRAYSAVTCKAHKLGIHRPTGRRAEPLQPGQRFGRLVVVEPDIRVQSGERTPKGARLRCDCGNMTEVVLSSLRHGSTRSCGCLEQEARTMPKVRTRRLFVQPGQRFGLLTVLEPDVQVKGGKQSVRRARVACDCGNERTPALSDLIRGFTQSCGCAKPDLSAEALLAMQRACTTHGLSTHPLYLIWRGMISRCENPTNASYPRYGGRGIEVYGPWHDPVVFIRDIEAEIGPRPEGRHPSGMALFSLDRVQGDGNYEPGNVQWATAQQQAQNRCLETALRRLREENIALRARVHELEHRLAWGLGD